MSDQKPGNDGERQPWWASEDPAGHATDSGSSHGEHTRPAWMDAVEAIDGAMRAAAKGARGAAERVTDVRDGLAGQVDGAQGDQDGEGSPGNADGGDGGADGHRHGAVDAYCHLCPVCSLLRALEDVRPEVLVHLTQAARHVTLAAKAVIDAQSDRFGPDQGFESINLED
ncbi:MAG: hypothetical protein ACI867_000140 [Glaciecola sp.]|jgi:hypothetical protein